MSKTDACELELMAAFDKGALKSVATKAELAKFKGTARATALQGELVSTRLSSGDWRLARPSGQGAETGHAPPAAHGPRAAPMRDGAAGRALSAQCGCRPAARLSKGSCALCR